MIILENICHDVMKQNCCSAWQFHVIMCKEYCIIEVDAYQLIQ